MGCTRVPLRPVVTMAVAILAMAAVAACGSKNSASSATPPKGTPAAALRSTPVASTSDRTFSKAPAFTIDPNKGYVADIKTEKGDIIIELNAKAAPFTVNNFLFLAQQHFYDGLTFHRVVPSFVAQGGDPKGDGSGGPGYTIPDEKSPLLHDTGAVAMAKTSAPNSAGSQFYITMAPQPALDGKYTVFGQVTSGMDVVNQLTPRDPASATTPGDKIVSITISQTNATPTPFATRAATATPAR
jgi:peptidylprolyl isomerase